MAGGVPGVTARGNRVQIAFTYQGVRFREALPARPTPANLARAAQLLESVKWEIATGTFDYAKRFPTSKNALRYGKEPGTLVTVEKALNDWLIQKQAKCEWSTIRDYKSIISHHLLPAFGKHRLSDLKARDIRDWYYQLPISAKRKNNVLGVLHAMYEQAVRDEIVPKNPAKFLDKVPNKTREPQPFTVEEMERIIAALPEPVCYHFQFAFWTGLRTSEHIALDWSDVDLPRSLAFVRRARVRGHDKGTKTSNGTRTIELLPAAREALLKQAAYSGHQIGPVFYDHRCGKPYRNDQALRRCFWQPVLKSLGIAYRPPYQTRHTYASLRLMEGRNPGWLAHQMGHRSPWFTYRTYARWISEECTPKRSVPNRDHAHITHQRT